MKFYEMAAENDEQSQSSSRGGTDQKLSFNNLSNHWLFKTVEGTESRAVKHCILPNCSEKLDMASLQEAFEKHLKELEKQQNELPVLDEECSPIQEDVSILATDQPKYLFKDDTLISKRDTNPAMYRVPKKPSQQTKEGSFPNYFIKLGTRLHLPRKAKNKENNYSTIDDFGDDDDDNDFETQTKRKACKDVDTMSKQPLKKIKNDEYIDITSEDEDKSNKMEGSISLDKVTNVNDKEQKRPGFVAKASEFLIKAKSTITSTITKSSSQEMKLPEDTTSKEPKKDKVGCPMCNKMFSQDDINEHAFDCQGPVETRATRGTSKIGKDASDFAPWTSACHKMESFPRSERNTPKETIQIDINTKTFVGKPEGYSVRERSRQLKSSSTNLRNKENLQDRHSPIPNFNKEDSDTEDIFEGYAQNQSRKKPVRTYSRPTHPRNFLNDSQPDESFIKCGKCDNVIHEKNYEEHTDNCLDNSHIVLTNP